MLTLGRGAKMAIASKRLCSTTGDRHGTKSLCMGCISITSWDVRGEQFKGSAKTAQQMGGRSPMAYNLLSCHFYLESQVPLKAYHDHLCPLSLSVGHTLCVHNVIPGNTAASPCYSRKPLSTVFTWDTPSRKGQVADQCAGTSISKSTSGKAHNWCNSI